jgi:iron complex transport system permease protein
LRHLLYLLFFLILYFALLLLSLSIGVYRVYTPFEAVSLLLWGDSSNVDRAVVELRLWRSIAATMVGVGLAVSGLIIQRLLGNPMADPYILGISPGAALGYLSALAFGFGYPVWYLVAFLGGLAAYATVISIASIAGLTSLALIVVGVALSYALSSLLVIAIFLLGPQLGLAIAWLFGTIAYTSKTESTLLSVVVLVGLVFIAVNRGALTALLLGEEVSKAMGVNVEALRLSMTATAAFIVSLITAVSGPVGFVGLTAPWVARVTVGASFNRLLVASIIVGAILVIGSDIIVRVVGGGRELPLTAITSLVGAPILLYLSVRGRHAGRL